MYEKTKILCIGVTVFAITLAALVVVLVQGLRKGSSFLDSSAMRKTRETCLCG